MPTDENEALDENDASDKKKILSLKQNEQVMAMLMIAMNTDQGMSKVMQEMNRSPIFQTGQAWRVIKMIKEECRPEDDIAAMEMETEVAKIKLKKGENPKTLTEKMANIEVRFGMPIDDKKRTGVVLRCGKDHYAESMTATSVSIRRTEKRAATCDELLADMYTQWRIQNNTSGGKKGKDEDDVKETALVSKDEEDDEDNGKTEPASNDKRKCYKCGETGHIARDCPKKGSTEKNVVVCNHCNKPGHKQDDCWVRHPEKKPGYVNTSGASVEILVASLEIEEELWNADELAVPSRDDNRLLNLVDSKDLWYYDQSLDGQEGLCEKEDESEGLNNLVDSKGLIKTEQERLVNSDELEDRSRSTENEKRLNNLVDSKDLKVYELGDHGFGTEAEDKDNMYVGSRGYGTKYEEEKKFGSRGCDTKYEEEENGSRGYDTNNKYKDDMYVSNHGLGAVLIMKDENEKIEKKVYSEVDECTPDIQSKEGVRSDQMVLCSVGVGVGDDVCWSRVGQNSGSSSDRGSANTS